MERMIHFFGIQNGITAIIGGGGKTTLLYALAETLQQSGSVLVSTSTHIRKPDHLPFTEHVVSPLSSGTSIVVGTPDADGKLTAPRQDFFELAAFCDYLLVEADGARGLPLKAHNLNEPVLPLQSKKVLAVVGLDGIGASIEKAAHRPEQYAALCHALPHDIVTPERCVAVLNTYPQITGIVLNKADTPERLFDAHSIAALLPYPVAVTTLKPEKQILELWRNRTCCWS